jgi:hypothetical protein
MLGKAELGTQVRTQVKEEAEPKEASQTTSSHAAEKTGADTQAMQYHVESLELNTGGCQIYP